MNSEKNHSRAGIERDCIEACLFNEYKLGDPERGKTIFEGIVDSHPKRWDMWSIYMDMEATQDDMMSLR